MQILQAFFVLFYMYKSIFFYKMDELLLSIYVCGLYE